MARPIPWSENFAVGHVELDRQHRRLIELINAIDAAAQSEQFPERLAGLLQLLRVATEEHIRQENALLWEIRSGTYAPLQGRVRTLHFLKAIAGSAFDEHMAEHAMLLARFDSIVGGPLEALCDGLKVWFVDHAIKHDSYLKVIFQAI